MMHSLFKGGFLGNMSGFFAPSLVLIPTVGLISFFLFYQTGDMGGTATGRFSNTNLRLRNSMTHRSPTPPSSSPVIIDSDDCDNGFLDEEFFGHKVPECARDVFVTLHKHDEGARGADDNKEEAEGDDNNDVSCKGLLLRDDIIVTSNECSKLEHVFDFAGFGLVRAKPHADLNSRLDSEVENSRLGFLEASPPYHYHFIHMPVRRLRMFLGHNGSSNSNSTEANGASSIFMTCGNEQEPIAYNFPVGQGVGGMVPLGILAGIVPEDILWIDDIGKAPMLQYKSHRWWDLPISLGHEQATIKKMLDWYDGPPGSISIPWAHNDFFSRAVGLCEAVDPRGHRRDCFENYYLRWQREVPFSGMHFFDWLDFGPGKFLLEKNKMNFEQGLFNQTIPPMDHDEECLKRDFNRRTVHYFNDEERRMHEIYFKPSKDGRQLIARYKHNHQLVPQSEKEDPHLYMWDLNKTFYLVDNIWDKDTYGRIKHTGVMAGQPGLSGGKAYFGENGAMWGINFSSGHYRPDIHAAAMMYQWMKNKGFNLTAFHWVGRKSWSTENCQKTDWKNIQIPGFKPNALNQSCHDVTVSPTWILKDDV